MSFDMKIVSRLWFSLTGATMNAWCHNNKFTIFVSCKTIRIADCLCL